MIVRKMLTAKRVDLPDLWTFKLIKNRSHNALLALDARGVTARAGAEKVGRTGREPRRALHSLFG